MIKIDSIEQISKTKYKVILEDGYVLPLYQSEIRRFNLKEDAYTDFKEVERIKKEVLLPRAKSRAVYILTASPKTEKQLSDKLKAFYYGDDIIGAVLAFLKKYNYVNDYEYAENYIRQKSTKYGINRIKNELIIKGIQLFVISEVVQENDYEDNNETLKRIIEQKKERYNITDKKELNKLVAYLVRRGFSYSQISKLMTFSE